MPELKATIVQVTPFQQNCLLLWDAATGRGSVFDPGGEADRIFSAISEAGVTVESILLTHGHLDHAGAAEAVQQRLADVGQPVLIIGPDRRDEFLLADIAADARRYGLDGMANCTPDRWLAEGEQVAAAGLTFDVLHCPGHTPGHVAFVCPAAKFAVVGDVLFHGSIGRTDFPYGDTDALLRSIRQKLLPLGDDIGFLCGHGPGSTFGTERRSNPFLAGDGLR